MSSIHLGQSIINLFNALTSHLCQSIIDFFNALFWHFGQSIINFFNALFWHFGQSIIDFFNASSWHLGQSITLMWYSDTALDLGLRLLVWQGELFPTLLVVQGDKLFMRPWYVGTSGFYGLSFPSVGGDTHRDNFVKKIYWYNIG